MSSYEQNKLFDNIVSHCTKESESLKNIVSKMQAGYISLYENNLNTSIKIGQQAYTQMKELDTFRNTLCGEMFKSLSPFFYI